VVAVAFMLVWLGYSQGLWGYCLLRDYNVTFGQLVSPVHPYAGPWPPPAIPAGNLWPGKAGAGGPTGGGVTQQQTGGGQISVGPGSVTVPFGGFPLPIPLSAQQGGGGGTGYQVT
jgi:hypothetical protein